MTTSEEQRLARMRRGAKLRELGRPLRILPHELRQLEAVIRDLHSKGMTAADIGRESGIHAGTVGHIVHRPGTVRYINRPEYERTLKLEYKPPVGPGSVLPTTLTVRRVGALWAHGLPLYVQGEVVGATDRTLARLIRGDAKVIHHDKARQIAETYEWLSMADPLDRVTPDQKKRAQRAALGRGFAPPGCWDDDTIDDPDAEPEWTGACGTGRGKMIHQRDGIPMCKPCSKKSVRYVKAGGDEEYDFDVERFKVLAERTDLSKDTLADGLNVAFGTLNLWLTGERQPTPEKLESVAGFFRVHVSDLKL